MNKATTWREYFNSFQDISKLDSKLQVFKSLMKYGDGGYQVLRALERNDKFMYLSVSAQSLNSIQLLHHFGEAGGSLVDAHLYSLCLAGEEETAFPMKFNSAILAPDVSVQVPVLSELMKCTTREEVIDLDPMDPLFPDEKCTMLKCKQIVPLPRLVSDLIMSHDSTSDAASLMVILVKAFASLDVDNEKRVNAQPTQHLGHIVQFLWAAAHKLVKPIPLSPGRESVVKQWSKHLHKLCLAPKIQHPPPAPPVAVLAPVQRETPSAAIRRKSNSANDAATEEDESCKTDAAAGVSNDGTTTTTTTTTTTPMNKRDKKWDERYQELKVYHEVFGNCNVPASYTKSPKLASWVLQQKAKCRQYERGEQCSMTTERFRLLKELDIDYESKGRGNAAGKLNEAGWLAMLEKLKEYKKAHGDCNVPKRYVDPKLGQWVMSQRYHYTQFQEGKKTTLTAERLAALQALDFQWVGNPGRKRKVPEGDANRMNALLQKRAAQQATSDQTTGIATATEKPASVAAAGAVAPPPQEVTVINAVPTIRPPPIGPPLMYPNPFMFPGHFRMLNGKP